MSQARRSPEPVRRYAVPLGDPRRIAGVDLARGLAVIGMLAAHLLVTEPFSWGEPGTWIDVVDGRSSMLFALLAGVSTALVSGGPVPPAGKALRAARRRLLWRAPVLWLLGMLLILTGVPVYVILPAYAILFAVAAPLLSLRAPALLSIAGAGLLVMPFVQAWLGMLPFWHTEAGDWLGLVIGWAYPFPLWSMYLIAGLGIGRLRIREPRVALALTAVGAGMAAVGYTLPALVPGPFGSDYSTAVMSVAPHSGGLPEAVGSTGFVVLVLGACLLLCRGPVRAVLLPLRATGSMPLSAYTAQLVAWAVWAQLALGETGDLAAFRALEPFWPLTLCLVGGATAWALLAGRGPLERLLDRVVPRAG